MSYQTHGTVDISELAFSNSSKALSEVLWDQTPPVLNPGSYYINSTQNYSSPYEALSCQVADDFTIPLGESWTVQEVFILGLTFKGPISTVNVKFFEPNPIAPFIPQESPFITWLGISTFTDIAGNLTIPIPDTVLFPGNHWVSVSINSNPNIVEWTAATSLETVPIGSEGVWEQPGNGSGTGATTWTPLTAAFPVLGPNLLFRLTGLRNSVPCIHPDTKVTTEKGIRSIKEIEAGDYVIDHEGKKVKVVYNIFFPTEVNEFVKITAGCLGNNLPEQDILIRKGHPILHNGREENPIKLAGKLKMRDQIYEVKINDYVPVYSLCTKKRSYIKMQGVPVASWGRKSWETFALKKPNMVWSKK